MAATLKMATLDGSTYADLLAGVLKLEDATWTARTAAPARAATDVPYGAQPALSGAQGTGGAGYAPVVEALDLVAKDTAANIAGAIAGLDSLLASAGRWHTTRHDPQSMWLYHAAAGETAARRALIYEGSLAVLTAEGLDPMLTNAAARICLTLTRHPLWEPVTSSVQTADNHVLWGSKWTLSAIPGNEPARIRDLAVKPRFGGGGPLYRLWIGLREPFAGTANFDPVWELEDGTNGVGAADMADATASPGPASGAKVQVGFADPTMQLRMSIQPSQAAIRYGHMNYAHYAGNYQVLLRCKVTAGATAYIQLRVGYTNSATTIPIKDEFVSNSSWRLIPLGVVSIPPHGYRDQVAANSNVGTTQLQIWAQHMAGTPATDTLDLDAISLIPADHYASIQGTEVEYRPGDDTPAHFFTFEDDTELACGYRYGKPSLSIDPSRNGFYLPVGQSMIVVAGERETSHVLTEANDLRVEYLPRWLGYRST